MKRLLIQLYLKLKKIGLFIRMIFGSDYRKLLFCKQKRLILLDTPTHGNLGDHAIVIAMKKFLQDNIEGQICEFTHVEYRFFKRFIKKRIRSDDTIILPGGGFLGTLWTNEEEIVLDILNLFKKNKIVIFPQTVYFSNDSSGAEAKHNLCLAMKECDDLVIMLRDKSSYLTILDFNIPAKILFIPDIVTYLDFNNKRDKSKTVLICCRDDIERTFNSVELDGCLQKLTDDGYKVVKIDTVEKCEIAKKKRVKHLSRKLQEFSKASLVITDRLHGMLFSIITSTPCCVFDNLSKKVSGTADWLSYLSYVRFFETSAEFNHFRISEFIESKNLYTNIPLMEKYKEIIEALKV